MLAREVVERGVEAVRRIGVESVAQFRECLGDIGIVRDELGDGAYEVAELTIELVALGFKRVALFHEPTHFIDEIRGRLTSTPSAERS